MRALVPKMATPPARHAAMRRATTGRILAGPGGRRAPPPGRRSSMRAVADDLHGLVALAGDHDDVAGRGLADGQGDGGRPVGLDGDGGVGGHAGADGLDDGERVLAARVVRGQDHPVGEAGRHLAHLRPLARVAVAAGADDDDHPAARPRPRGRPPARPPGRRACGRSRRARRTAGPRRPARTGPGPAAPRPGPSAIVAVGDAEPGGGGGGRQRVAHVEAAAERQRDRRGRATGSEHDVVPTDEVLGVGEGVARRSAPCSRRASSTPRGSSRFTTAASV